MNIYRPCVCLVLRKLHNICSQTLMIACSEAKKHTYTIPTVGKMEGFWLAIWLDAFCNLKHIALLEPLHHHAAALQGEEGRASVDHWEMWGSQHHLAAARSKPERRRPRLWGRWRMGLGNAAILTYVQVEPESRGSGLTQCCVTRQPGPLANQANSTVGNRSICVTLKGCINHTHGHEKRYFHS